ncbi:hypothetical protein [Brachybacterium huguangmaarense]
MSRATVLLEPLAVDGSDADATPPCRAWSAHAEHLALAIAPDIALWPDTPTTRSVAADGSLVLLRPGVRVPRVWTAVPADRAVSIGCALGDDLRVSDVIAGASAAWVWVGGAAPLPLDLITLARPRTLAGVSIRQAPLARTDVEAVGGCPVTVPDRTAVDLLRFEDDERRTAWLVRALVDSGHATAEAIDGRLARLDGRPHARSARERWERISGRGSPPAGRHRPACRPR